MRQLLTGRIVDARWKLLYVVGVLFLGVPLVWIAPQHPVLDFAIGVFAAGTVLVGVWYGARIFRGRGEPVAPDRPWWRFTAWPGLSWLVGAYFLANTAWLVFKAELSTFADPNWWLTLIQHAALGVAYLGSAVRLTAAGIRKPLPQRRALLQPPNLG